MRTLWDIYMDLRDSERIIQDFLESDMPACTKILSLDTVELGLEATLKEFKGWLAHKHADIEAGS